MENTQFVDEKSLWINLKHGDKAAFECIYRMWSPALFKYGKLYSPDSYVVEDAIQDLFIHIWNSRVNLSTPDSVSSYLHIALRNRLLKQLGKQSAYTHVGIEDSIIETQVADAIPVDFIDDTDLQIRYLYANLPARQKEVLHYRYICGMSIAEIGEAMEMNAQSVQNLLQRALKKSVSLMSEQSFVCLLVLLSLFLFS